MFKTKAITIVILAILALGFIYLSPGDKYKIEGEKHLVNIKMITEEGQNAESYLSFDEKKLIELLKKNKGKWEVIEKTSSGQNIKKYSIKVDSKSFEKDDFKNIKLILLIFIIFLLFYKTSSE